MTQRYYVMMMAWVFGSITMTSLRPGMMGRNPGIIHKWLYDNSYFQAIDLLEFSQIRLKFFRRDCIDTSMKIQKRRLARSFVDTFDQKCAGEICRMWYGHECLAVGHFRPWISRLYLFGSKVPMGHLLTFLLSRSLQLFIATSWISIVDSLNTHTHMVQMVHV